MSKELNQYKPTTKETIGTYKEHRLNGKKLINITLRLDFGVNGVHNMMLLLIIMVVELIWSTKNNNVGVLKVIVMIILL